jgi:hypothetical protein
MITEVERIHLENLKSFEKIKSFANSPPPPPLFFFRPDAYFLANTPHPRVHKTDGMISRQINKLLRGRSALN